jgi:hypothetical protein
MLVNSFIEQIVPLSHECPGLWFLGVEGRSILSDACEEALRGTDTINNVVSSLLGWIDSWSFQLADFLADKLGNLEIR